MTLAASQSASAGQIILGIVVLLVIIGLYFLPLLIAWRRHLDNVIQIALLNFFLGWTGIGWIVALIWANKPIPASPRQAGN
jgi:Superinfection immunity protein